MQAMIQDDDAVQTGVRLSCEALQPAQDYASRAPPGCSHGEVWVEVVNRLAGDEALMLPRVTVPVEGGGEDAAGDGEAEEAAGKAQWEAMTPVTVPLRDVIRSGVKVVLWEQWHAAPAPEGGKDAAANAGEDGEVGLGVAVE